MECYGRSGQVMEPIEGQDRLWKVMGNNWVWFTQVREARPWKVWIGLGMLQLSRVRPWKVLEGHSKLQVGRVRLCKVMRGWRVSGGLDYMKKGDGRS